MQQVSAQFFQFTTEGDVLDGVYMGCQPITWQDGKEGKSHYINCDGVLYNFNGTYNLDRDLAMVPPGVRVSVEFTGTAPTRRGQNPVRKFVVMAETVIAPPPAPAPPPSFDSPGSQPMLGGMSTADIHAANRADNVRVTPPPATGEITPRTPLEFLPDGRPVYGFTRDGDALDAYGKIIALAGDIALDTDIRLTG